MQIDLAALIKRVGEFRRDRYLAPRIDPTVAQRDDLLRIYMAVVRGWQEAWQKNIRPVYERSLSELISDDADDLQLQIALSENQLAAIVAAAGVSAREWLARVELWHRKRFAQAFVPTGVNIDTLLGAGDVAGTLRAQLAENTALIRSLNDEMRSRIAGHVFRGLQNRSTARDVAREIAKAAKIGRARANLIAADQLQKITGRLDQERQEQVGIRKFEWAHSGKANPRQEHLARDGKVFAWNSSVAKNDPPGRAIRCGCRARAVLDI